MLANAYIMAQDKKPFLRKNDYIRAEQIRLIDADGIMIGIKTLQEGKQLALSRGLDLVEISPTAKPPVCKVLDYSKYIYDLEKKMREARKKQKVGLLKEIRFKSRIATHDFDTKVSHAEEFLKKKDKVRLTVVFRGRENQHKDIGRGMLMGIKDKLSAVADPEGNIQTAGNRMSWTFAPKN